MAQKQKAQKQPQDPYGQRGKSLASTVQKLRGWVGSDPSRTPELADALVELTAHRLLGHAYAAAAADAQDGVRLSAQLLTASGPIGPYTSVTDAARCLTTVVQVATIQAGLGLTEAAGRTLESLQDLRQQLQGLLVEEHLTPQTAIWALWSTARVAVASGDAARANAYADAALARLVESGVGDDADAVYVALDADRAVSDCRWAAGRAVEALTHLHLAKDRHDGVVAGRLQQPSRLSPALVERLAEPLFGLYTDLADRLAATSEPELGLVVRRALVEQLQALGSDSRQATRSGRGADPVRVQLSMALADLTDDLLRADRVDEAVELAAEADAAAPAGSASLLLVRSTYAQALTGAGRPGEAVAMLRQVLPADSAELRTAAHAVGLTALVQALRASGDEAAAATEQTLDRVTAELLGHGLEPSSAGRRLRDMARGVVPLGVEPVSWVPLPDAESYAATTAAGRSGDVDVAALEAEHERETTAWLESERAEAQTREQRRMESARVEAEHRETRRVEAERAAAAQLAAERQRAEEAERLAAQRRAAAEEEERIARKRRREERLEAYRREAEARAAEAERAEHGEHGDLAEPAQEEQPSVAPEQPAELTLVQDLPREQVDRPEPEPEAELEPEPKLAPELEPEPEPEPEREPDIEPQPEPDELAVAQQAWQDARARGDRRGARAANERVVELLRPRAEADLAQYGPLLVQALEDLSSARLRSGDIWGSRAPAREARTLAKTLGR